MRRRASAQVSGPRGDKSDENLQRLVGSHSIVVGILFVLYLIYDELIRIGQICAYCTSIHIITFVLFVLIQAAAPPKPRATA